MHASRLRLALTAATLLAALPLTAQTRPSFGIAGGAAFATGDLGDTYKSGYDIAAFVGFKPAVSPVGFRIEGAFNQFDRKNAGNTNAHINIFGVTGNVVITPSTGANVPGTIHPYLLGGLGIYNVKAEASATTGGTTITASNSDTKLGLNGGAGLDLPLTGIAVFVEARFHYVFTDSGNSGRGYNATYVPIVVGLRF